MFFFGFGQAVVFIPGHVLAGVSARDTHRLPIFLGPIILFVVHGESSVNWRLVDLVAGFVCAGRLFPKLRLPIPDREIAGCHLEFLLQHGVTICYVKREARLAYFESVRN